MWLIYQNKYLFRGRTPVERGSVLKVTEKVDEQSRSATPLTRIKIIISDDYTEQLYSCKNG